MHAFKLQSQRPYMHTRVHDVVPWRISASALALSPAILTPPGYHFMSTSYVQLASAEGEYRQALQLFAEVLASAPAPQARAAARAAIGACYIKLGEFPSARNSYDRALAVHQDSAPALAGRAAVELLAPGRSEVSEGVALLAAAHERDGAAAGVCNALALCHLLRGEMAEAESLAQHAVRCFLPRCHDVKTVEWQRESIGCSVHGVKAPSLQGSVCCTSSDVRRLQGAGWHCCEQPPCQCAGVKCSRQEHTRASAVHAGTRTARAGGH